GQIAKIERLTEREQRDEQKPIDLTGGRQKQRGLHARCSMARMCLLDNGAQPRPRGGHEFVRADANPNRDKLYLRRRPAGIPLPRRGPLRSDGGGHAAAQRRGRGRLANQRTCLSVVLAAGEGTRMRSARPKVLHAIAGRSLLNHVLDAVRQAGGTMTAVVVGVGADAVAAEAKRILPNAEIFVQAERRGTAHAVLAAKAAIARVPDDVLVILRDTPLIPPQTLTRIREALAKGAAVVVLGFRPRDPTGYGRLVVEGGELLAIREEVDASATERAITLCNGGLMAFAGPTALEILERI